MAKGFALTIGLNHVNRASYEGWDGELLACEADAQDMAALARSREFSSETLLADKASRTAVLAQIKKAADLCKAGDIFLLTYSGHGGQLPDYSNDEPDNFDETWCLYDGQMLDDEIYVALGDFAKGVRILVFSDSCHSGTVLKVAGVMAASAVRAAPPVAGNDKTITYRAMPLDVAARTYRAHRRMYDALLSSEKLANARAEVKASALLISGCQDNQLSLDGLANGLFTGTLLRVWNEGRFVGNYRSFHREIVDRMPHTQTPNYFWVGLPDPAFETQQVFSVAPSASPKRMRKIPR